MKLSKLKINNRLLSLALVLCLAMGMFIYLFSQKVNYSQSLIDVSWPNCRASIATNYANSIVGVNYGLDFKTNPCLGYETTLATNYELYFNTGDPGFPRIKLLGGSPLSCPIKNNLICYSYNYGYQAGLYDLRQAYLANAHSDYIFLDVETDNSWTTSHLANRADIIGMINAIDSYDLLTPKLAIYTTTYQWQQIVGKWHLNLPLWLATGGLNRAVASLGCHQLSATNGQIIISQYTIGNLDYDIACHQWQPTNFFNNSSLG